MAATMKMAAGEVSPDVAKYRRALAQGHGNGSAFGLLLGFEPQSTEAMLRRLQDGFPFQAFEHLRGNTALPVEALLSFVRIPQRTLARRKSRGTLDALESERLVRLARLFGLCIELFEGDVAAARRWLVTPQKALSGATPLEMGRTELGAREVENLIGRLEHGVFS